LWATLKDEGMGLLLMLNLNEARFFSALAALIEKKVKTYLVEVRITLRAAVACS